jgi:ribosomal protein L19
MKPGMSTIDALKFQQKIVEDQKKLLDAYNTVLIHLIEKSPHNSL